MAKWFYYNEQGDKIETTGGKLKGLAKAGLITPETVVENEEGKKAKAGKVKGLTFGVALAPDLAPNTEVYGLSKPEPLDDTRHLNDAEAELSGFASWESVMRPVDSNPFTVAAREEINPFTAAPVTAERIRSLLLLLLRRRWLMGRHRKEYPHPLLTMRLSRRNM